AAASELPGERPEAAVAGYWRCVEIVGGTVEGPQERRRAPLASCSGTSGGGVGRGAVATLAHTAAFAASSAIRNILAGTVPVEQRFYDSAGWSQVGLFCRRRGPKHSLGSIPGFGRCTAAPWHGRR